MQSVFSNEAANKTDDSDVFCTELYLGPLVWGIVTVSSASVGVPASVWLLWVLVQRQRQGFSNDVYMFNLTIMDMYFTLFMIPDVLNYLIFRDRIILKISDTIFCFAVVGRPLLMSCICVDCYIAVVHPTQYMVLKHSRHRTVFSALVWGLTLAYGLLSALRREIFATSFIAIPYIFTVPTIIFCDVMILLALRKPHPSGRSDVHPLKQRAVQTITNSLVMTFVSYLPPLIVIGLLSFLPLSTEEKICSISLPFLIAPILGSTIMPLLSVKNLGRLRCGRMCKV